MNALTTAEAVSIRRRSRSLARRRLVEPVEGERAASGPLFC